MKTILLSISAVILTISAISLAKSDDRTLMGSLNANETKPVKFQLQPGNFEIKVLPNKENAKLSCKYVDGAGNVGLEQKSTSQCKGLINTTQLGSMTLVLTNENDSRIDYSVFIKDNSK